MMRKAIQECLKTQLITLEGRIFQPFTATSNIRCPYAVVKLAIDSPDTKMKRGHRQRFEVWPYVKDYSLYELDDLVSSIISALHGVTLTTDNGHSFESIYDGSVGSEYHDEKRKLFTKGLRFHYDFVLRR